MDPQAQAELNSFPPFIDRVEEEYRHAEKELDVLQVNVGSLCNLACRHCHIEAGPNRTEIMTRETMQHCLDAFVAHGFKTLDITGGAPEMNPHFEWFIREAATLGISTMVRSNLVVMHKPEYAHLPELYAQLGINVIASLPHYSQRSMEKQRGEGTFEGVISMLQRLNKLGYGAHEGAGKGTDKTCANASSTTGAAKVTSPYLQLDLVHNPGGAFLPPDQAALEKEYRQKLAADFGIVFDNLFVFTNNPLGRFGDLLYKKGALNRYMNTLVDAFNPATVPAMMCRLEYSVGWDGRLYDCDFNLAAGLPCKSGLTIADLAADPSLPLSRAIVFGNHCYACCAGAGSS